MLTRRSTHRSWLSLLISGVACAAGCTTPQLPLDSPHIAETAETPPGKDTPPKPADLSVPPVQWENPGGMWMPEQLASHQAILEKIGFRIDAKALSQPTGSPLGAIVFLGGCSASFVSPDGLIITNHHCVIGALQYNSTPQQNLLVDGFVAKTRADEKSNGPSSRVFVTTKFSDVTATLRKDLDKAGDDARRYQLIEDRQKAIVAECEKDRPEYRCSVASYFGTSQYVLIEQLELRDIRLVYAPPEGVGNYGGEIDNWRWPRHSGDFAFYRAYVGADGKPKNFAADNVPYKPKEFLRVAKEPLKPGDPVLVAGYPARTNRLTTATETHEAVKYELPYILDFTAAYLGELEKIAKKDKDLAIKAETFIRGLANWQTNTKGQLEGLEKGGLEKTKAESERALRAYVDADPARKKKYGAAFGALDKLNLETQKTKEKDAIVREVMRMVRLVSTAHSIVRNAEEREKKSDKDRDPEYQDRNQERLAQGMVQLTKTLSKDIDVDLLVLAIERDEKLPKGKGLGLAALVGGVAGTKASDKAADEAAKKLGRRTDIGAMFEQTKLGDEATRVTLMKSAKLADLKKSDDPLIKVALKLRPTTKGMEERDKKLTGAMAMVRPLFVEAMREQAQGKLAPDANRTLRVTYGTVRGYAPKPGEPVYYPFTKLSEVVAKNTGKDPFVAPPGLVEAWKQKKFGNYVDEKLQEVPVDFLTDLDITGGNSGSATLNRNGELVGLAFDGNYESIASDWMFMPSITRSIHVDIRYALWFMDAVSGADHLLQEMGIKPSVN